MQEFESISASSYDPSALATKLTAKAADGWSVVAIVPTGGDVTAFLSRDSSAGSGSVLSGGAADMSAATESSGADFASTETAVEPGVEPAAATYEPEPEPEPEPESVAEPAGWAIAPEPVASSTSSGTGTSERGEYAASTTSEPSSSYQPSSTYQPTIGGVGTSSSSAGSSGYSGSSAPATPAPSAPEPAPAPSVPAGWYADPAGRFELRYWDGSTWTEHVSRASQQFTDPPVA